MLIEIIYKTFKAHHSTDQCKFVAQKVIQYYLNNGSEVYGCTLEMQKAFDKLDLLKFFGKLEVHQLPVHMLRLLFFLYYGLLLRFYWQDTFSDSSTTHKGTKQGKILSSILFSVFINDLLDGLKKLDVGCFVDHHYFGCLAYTNDIVLLAPTLQALTLMLDLHTDFAQLNNINFNPGKSHCIKFWTSNELN